jgi:hypothetical protein
LTQPRKPLLWRLAPIGVALASLALVQRLYAPRDAALLVRVPAGAENVGAISLRVTRDDGKEMLRAVREKKSREGRTFVVTTKLPPGRHRLDAWPEPPDGRAWTAPLAFEGEEAVEVELAPR